MKNSSPIKIYANKIENRAAFKIASEYYHESLAPKTIKLLGSKQKKTEKERSSENMLLLRIAEVMLVH